MLWVTVLFVGLLSGCAGTKTGSLVIESSPSGARVIIEGKQVGTTPLRLPGIPEGVIAGTIEQAGYETESFRSVIEPDKETVLSLALTPEVSTLLVDAARLTSPADPAKLHVIHSALTATEIAGKGPYPRIPFDLYWDSFSKSNRGRAYVETAESELAAFIHADFSALPPDDQVLGSLSVWIAPDGYWRVRQLGESVALVRFTYRGGPVYDFVVIKENNWRLLRKFDSQREGSFDDVSDQEILANNADFLLIFKEVVTP